MRSGPELFHSTKALFETFWLQLHELNQTKTNEDVFILEPSASLRRTYTFAQTRREEGESAWIFQEALRIRKVCACVYTNWEIDGALTLLQVNKFLWRQTCLSNTALVFGPKCLNLCRQQNKTDMKQGCSVNACANATVQCKKIKIKMK